MLSWLLNFRWSRLKESSCICIDPASCRAARRSVAVDSQLVTYPSSRAACDRLTSLNQILNQARCSSPLYILRVSGQSVVQISLQARVCDP